MASPLYAVVLAGGIGSRFWPLSTPMRPKQLLPLIGDAPMLADTVARLVLLVGRERVLILTSESIAEPVLRTLPGFRREQLLLEPRAAGTAAALTWAAAAVARLGGPDARMVCVHADWAIGDSDRFRTALQQAADAAAERKALATVGVVPSRPDPGLGYIQPGEDLGDGVRKVARFIEKPDIARATQMMKEGYLWNSGIFAWRATDLMDEVRALTPELASAMAHIDGTAADFFGAVTTPVSIDVGVLERSARVIVLPGEFGWDDVGTWGALQRVRSRDGSGNASHGRVLFREAHDNVVHAEGATAVLYGVEGLVVVVRDGVTLVTTVERSHELKALIDELPAALRELP